MPEFVPAVPPEKTAVLLLQLGTPDAPTPEALGPYLAEFLMDPRVIEAPRWRWWFILNVLIIPRRKHESADKYKRIWHPEHGSPLAHWTREARRALEQALANGGADGEGGDPELVVDYAMRYGKPSTASVLDKLAASGVRRILALPMYPQYSATTTASALDALFDAARAMRHMPTIRVVPPYYLAPGYVDAVARAVERRRESLDWEPELLVISFHGIPARYVAAGDPYRGQCLETAAALVQRMGLKDGEYKISFQSRFGREEWLTPYTDETLAELARGGLRRVMVVQPGFTADCLETVDEIGREAREAFEHGGGTHFDRVPCLNADEPWIGFLAELVRSELAGWTGAARKTTCHAD